MRWSDAKVQRLESLIGDFVAGLMRTAVAIRRQKHEQQQREVNETGVHVRRNNSA